MTAASTLPEDRPWTFSLPEDRDWLEPGDADYGWVLDDLREHDAIGFVLNLIVADTRYGPEPADVTLPVINYCTRRRIELTWPNVSVVFNPPSWWNGRYRINDRLTVLNPFDVRPDGRIMVTAAAFK